MTIDQQADAYVHGLLSPEEARTFERLCAESPEAASALARARARAELLLSLPPAEPAADLSQRVLSRLEREDQGRRSLRRRLVVYTALAVAACHLFLVGAWRYYSLLGPTGPDLHVHGQSQLYASSRAAVRLRLTEPTRGGRAIEGAAVSIELVPPEGQAIELCSTETDGRGEAVAHFQVPDLRGEGYTLRARAAGEVMTYPVTLTRPYRVMLSSDKPVYQPGQSIHLRALILRAADQRPAGGELAVFRMTDARGNVLFKEEVATSKYGIAAASCELDREATEGAYDLTCTVGHTVSKLTAEVKRYVLPKFTVEVTAHRPYYAPGETARAKVRALYTFGKPVAGADVELRLATSEDDARAEARKRMKTDENGEAEADLPIPAGLRGQDAQARIIAVVTDTAGHVQAREVRRIVTETPWRVDVLPEAGGLVPGVPNVLHLLARRVDGEPLAGARIEVSGPDGTSSVTTDRTGAASLELTPRLAPAELTLQAWVGGKPVYREERRIQSSEVDFLIRPDRARYRAGETVRLEVLTRGGHPVHVDILRGGQVILSGRVDVHQGKGSLSLDLPPELEGPLLLNAYHLEGYKHRPRHQSRLILVEPAKGLTVKADLDRKEYRPGGEAKLRLSLVDDTGRPVPGAVSLAAVDEAVYSVQAERTFQPHVFGAAEEAALSRVAAYVSTRSEEGSSPERDRAAIAAASKTAEGAPYNRSESSYHARKHGIDSLRRYGLQLVFSVWSALSTATLLLLYASLYLYFPWRNVLLGTLLTFLVACLLSFSVILGRKYDAAREGDFLGISKGLAKDGKLSDRGPTPFQGITPARGGPSDTPRLRHHFPETMFWSPQVVSDDHGAFAPVTIPLADSITTWRLTASAISAEGKMGSSTQGLRVFQPFFVDLGLPALLTRGDEVSLPVVVYSYLDRAQTVDLQAEARGGLELLAPGVARLDLGPREVRAVTLRVKAARVGEPSLKVTARAGDAADAIERRIEVVPDGHRIDLTRNGNTETAETVTFDIPANAIEGSLRAELKLYPSRLGQLVEGLEGVFRMPLGCFEQASSANYPNVLALDYLRRNRLSAPQVEARARRLLHLGYQRLVGFEVPGGGFDWYGRGPADVGLTAYGLMQMKDMARVYDVDPALLNRTRAWLLSKRGADGAWEGRWHSASGKLGITAYTAWAVFSGSSRGADPEPTRSLLLSHSRDSIRSPYILALVCLALQSMEAPEVQVAPYLDALEALQSREGEGMACWKPGSGERTAFAGHGLAGQVEATATAALALMAGKRHPEAVRKALAWLTAQKGPEGAWPSTQATVLALKALTQALDTSGKDLPREVRLTVNGSSHLVSIRSGQAEVLKRIDLASMLAPGKNTVRIEGVNGSVIDWQLATRHHVPGENPATPGSPLLLHLAYDRTKVESGGEVRVSAKLTNTTSGDLPQVMAELPVPPGMEASSVAFDHLVADGVVSKYEASPGRVLLYLSSLPPGKPLQVRYALRARTPARVLARGARAWEYYNPSIEARTGPVTFEVSEAR
jgi:uncharacterized protein YfaS (alpha-2-macroglobulin family)